MINRIFASARRPKEWTKPNIKDGVPTKYGWVVRHPENLSLGKNTDIGFGTYIQAENYVSIGENTQIGAHCAIYSRNTIDNTSNKIFIGKNVCIGAGTIILPDKNEKELIIAEGVKIGVLSLVTKSIYEKNTVHTGIPTHRRRIKNEVNK